VPYRESMLDALCSDMCHSVISCGFNIIELTI
jgi:hypothetical protein